MHLQVREALASKVSRERFGAELKGCFDGATQPSCILNMSS